MAAALEHWLPVMYTDTRQAVEIARLAEAAGFTGIALADHVAMPTDFASVHPSGERMVEPDGEFMDPFVVASAMLAVTSRLRVMTYVYIVTMREPWSVAKGAGTLSVMSDGRFGLGVGAGWLLEEIQLLGFDPATRGKRMDTDLATIQELLRTGRTAVGGTTVAMEPRPAEPTPIWVGGKSTAALRRAARYDGWLGMNYSLEETLDRLARLAELRAEDPRDRTGEMTLVLPMVEQTPGLQQELAGHGATATLAMPWYPGDPAAASLDAKRAAMERWAGTFDLV
jgi:alkanesulfonate monooxygenase SsuD/methylene tetrahydromethanopterin reductase-like flavin-dependent oxidoreductase (luciferase family)